VTIDGAILTVRRLILERAHRRAVARVAGDGCSKIAHMGKTGDAIKGMAVLAVMVGELSDPFRECRNATDTECPSLAPEQRHAHERPLESATPEPAAMVGGGTVSLMLPSSLTITVTA
jgi:hypothetical protein